MSLKQIEISGFKSFAKKSILEFKTPITAIVGPNGSGKSNVAEAFSFVLGEQSIKSLRGKRGEDLIWNGSKTVSKSNRAAVKAIFDNSKRLLDIDFDEVAIERVVHRDATNDYLVNGSKARLKDIVEILSKANIGPSGHHIISQGEADRILSVNPKERRVIIEDALGLKVFEMKKSDSRRRLEKTEENIKEVKALRREINPHLKFLEKQVEKIEKTIELKNNLIGLYKKFFAVESFYINRKKESLDRESKEPKEKLKELERDLEKAKARFEESRGESGGADLNKIKTLEEELGKLERKKQELILEEGRLEGELVSLRKIISRSEIRTEGEKISFGKVREFINSLFVIIDESRSYGDIDLIKENLNRMKEKARAFIGIGGEYEGDGLKEEKERIIEIERISEEIIMERKRIISVENQSRKKLEELKNKIESGKGESLEAEKEVYRIQSELSKTASEVGRIKNFEESLSREEADFKRELGEAGVLFGRGATLYQEVSVGDEDPRERDRQVERLREIQKIKVRVEEAGGASGEDIVREYKETKERDEFLEKELEDLDKTEKTLEKIIDDLESELQERFKAGVEKINEQFQVLFSLMFGGGHALLRVVKEKAVSENGIIRDIVEERDDDAEETIEGVDISVSLPRKKVKGLMMLSGGERALASIALIFAMSQVNPPPFIILDETDAALDEANSKRYGDMIEKLAEHSELILITHNRETMSRAGVLYGVTMGSDGISRLLSVDLEEAVEVAK